MTPPPRLILIRGISPLRTETSETEIIDALTETELALGRTFRTFDTRAHAEGVDSGYWAPVKSDVRALIGAIHWDLEQNGPAAVSYFGIEECPTLIALGAYLGDEHGLEAIDYDRDSLRFAWPETQQTLSVEPAGWPAERIEAEGDVTLRVELTYLVEDADVDQVVDPGSRLADLRIRPAGGVNPRPGLVRSQADVEHVRLEIRKALAAIESYRPGAQVIHLFVAGPVSICLAAGRELRLRNGRSTQTYRFRSGDTPHLTRALLLSPGPDAEALAPLNDGESAVVKTTLGLWRNALGEILAHADVLLATGQPDWPSCLVEPLSSTPTVPLPGIWTVARRADTVETTTDSEFHFDRPRRIWHLPERMLLAMHDAAEGDEAGVRKLARAFYWHEYLHDFQGLTEHTAAGVGAFPNCLERIDYVADAYGILHEVDFSLRTITDRSGNTVLGMLVDSITHALNSFWTFEPPPPAIWWQQRRVRRYLNWYWRREQIRNAQTLAEALELLSHPPLLEVAGPSISTDSRRVYWDLSRIGQADRLELAMVNEKGQLRRFATQANLSISGLFEAFRQRQTAQIEDFFAALFEHARQ